VKVHHHRVTRLLSLGEPTHRVEASSALRNELFRHLVEHQGYRSITIESDHLPALSVDAHVTDLTSMPPWHGTPILRPREFAAKVDGMRCHRRGRQRRPL
jgi:hypothetical protein